MKQSEGNRTPRREIDRDVQPVALSATCTNGLAERDALRLGTVDRV